MGCFFFVWVGSWSEVPTQPNRQTLFLQCCSRKWYHRPHSLVGAMFAAVSIVRRFFHSHCSSQDVVQRNGSGLGRIQLWFNCPADAFWRCKLSYAENMNAAWGLQTPRGDDTAWATNHSTTHQAPVSFCAVVQRINVGRWFFTLSGSLFSSQSDKIWTVGGLSYTMRGLTRPCSNTQRVTRRRASNKNGFGLPEIMPKRHYPHYARVFLSVVHWVPKVFR